jgi:hypothetical protein
MWRMVTGLDNDGLDQCFSTVVPRCISVPSNSSRCAAKLYNIEYSMQKILFFHHFGPFITLLVCRQIFYKISVQQGQKG